MTDETITAERRLGECGVVNFPSFSTQMHLISQTALRLRNRVTVALYRISDGRLGGTAVGLPVLLLTAPGRKTGIPRTTPVIYLEHDDSYVVVGSAFGTRSAPDWIKNLAAAESARIRIGDAESEVPARIAIGEEREQLWQHVIVPALPTIATHEAKSGRTFPVGILTKP
ncbi:deazaflavin-dependent oxidoreductase (nitroreductase family) [Rhodococcus sp. LBL1]|nr:deazaflavin-dependent oxidoreductase (nitroreductase family) [Rhodococcus sp. LBL1]MDH6685468.1 deazaflavin-dependent oxidoreductase (nitroreductase family) [Rhodococcus sp. LBL2]